MFVIKTCEGFKSWTNFFISPKLFVPSSNIAYLEFKSRFNIEIIRPNKLL